MHYLDNAATTMVRPEVAEVVGQTLRHGWGNPSSLYRLGMQAEETMTAARGVLAAALDCRPKEVYFTAGGTEGNNIAILGAARARRGWANRLVCTGYEHPSVLGPLAMLAQQEGFELAEIPPESDGRVDPEKLLAAVDEKTALVAAMQVNNETGAVLDVAALARAVKAKNPRTFVHVDGVQAFCKLPLKLSQTKVDSYAVSGHKLHAPKGVGALFLRSGGNVWPPFAGGGQENGLRPGTENTAYIAGFAKAVQLAEQSQKADAQRLQQLRRHLLDGLQALGGITIHSPGDGYAGTVMFSMPKGLRSQVMLNFLDTEYEVCVSSGSACSGGAASHTLTAMGVHSSLVDSAIRASFCGDNTEDDIDALLKGLQQGMAHLARRL